MSIEENEAYLNSKSRSGGRNRRKKFGEGSTIDYNDIEM